MSEGRLFWFVGAWLLPLFAACGAQTQDGGGTDTSTDWVRECNEDAACDDEEHCACGICTRECDTDADCSALSPDAECAEAPSSCEEPGSICVADPSFAWLSQEPEPNEIPDGGDDLTCVAAIDKAACCLQVVAVTRSALDAEPCLVETAGADLEQVWQEAAVCQTPDPCPGVSCTPFDARGNWEMEAVLNDDGACELVLCDGETCAGSPCDPRVGCGVLLVCDADSCDAEGTCRVRPDVECGPAYAPVCGCDGVTYGYACTVAGGPYDHDGECVVEEPAPPCDDGTCDGSPCDPLVGCGEGLGCDAPSCAEPGICRRLPAVNCPDTPVCGCNGVTYANSCEALGNSIDYEGQCVAEEPTPPCDDGTCDGSPCDPRVGCGERFGCDAPSCDEPGTCHPLPDADCTDNHNPVCGCNGVTYTNSCVALGNSIDHDGECVVEEPAPPCDDGTCDGSPCDPRIGCAEGLGCEAPGCDEPGICTPVPNVGCDGNYEPVCGCNAVTYGNACEATGNPIDYEGECMAAE